MVEKGILSALAAGLRGIYEQEGPLVDRCRCMQARVSAAELITDGGGKVTGNADGREIVTARHLPSSDTRGRLLGWTEIACFEEGEKKGKKSNH